MNKSKKYLLFLLFIILILIVKVLFNNKAKDNSNISSNNVWDKPLGNSSIIKLYIDNKTNEIVSFNNDESNVDGLDYDYLNTYKCLSKDCKFYNYNYLNNHIIIWDNDYIIYDYKKNLYKKINLPSNNYKDIKLIYYGKKDYGYAIKNDSNYYAYYSISDKEFKSDFIYDDILTDDVLLINNCFIGIINYNNIVKYNIVDYKNNKVIKSFDNLVGSIGNKNNIYYYERVLSFDDTKYIIYNNNFEKLENDLFYYIGITKAGNLIVSSDKKSFKIYNNNMVFIKESKPYNEIYSILNEYIIVKDNDNYLKIIDFDGNVLIKILYLDDYNSYLSSDYILKKEDELININIEDKNKDKKIYTYSIKNKSLNIYNEK